MANTMPDSKSTFTGNTFLGTRPGTITKGTTRAKSARDLRAARMRRDLVKAELNARSNAMNARAELARNQYMQLTSNAKPATGSYQYSYKGLGQYSGAGTSARESDASAVTAKALKDAGGNYLGAQARIRASQDNLGKNYLKNYTLDQETHDSYIALGEQWKDDLKMFERYSLATSGQIQLSEQEAADLEKAVKRWQDYYETYSVPKRIYNLDTGKYEDMNVLRSDAPLPPWVAPTARNRDIWRYYTEYIDATRTL